MTTIKNVSIGDQFTMRTKHHTYEVVDFLECISMVTGNTVKYICIAKGVNTFATNTFEVPFSTVAMTRSKKYVNP